MKCSLIPPALGVPQHMLWKLVDVPQGEFAEQLVPTGQTDDTERQCIQRTRPMGSIMTASCKHLLFCGGCSAFSLRCLHFEKLPNHRA